MRRKYVVRIAVYHEEMQANPMLGQFLEAMAFSRHVVKHDDRTWDLMPHRGENSADWAHDAAKKLKELGFNAEKAPAWGAGVQMEDQCAGE